MGHWKWSKTYLVFFRFKISQQIQSLEAIKVFAKMGRSWPADRAMAKVFLSIEQRHVMKKP